MAEAPDYGPVFQLVNDAVFVHDAGTGAILDVNRRAEQMYAATRDQIVASRISDISEGPEYGEAQALARLRAAAAGAPQVFEWRARGRDGRVFWVEVNIAPATIGGEGRLLAVVRDVTDRKRAEEASRDAERRLRAVLETIPQLVWTCDPEGRCDYLGQQWADYTGAPLEAGLGYGWLDRLHPDDRAPAREAWAWSVRTGRMLDLRLRFRRGDGVHRWFTARALAMKDAAGRVMRWFGTCTDVDDQVRAEVELRDADRRKNEFLGVLSHELRNPLAPIRNGLYLLDHATPGSAQARHAKEVIERQTEHLTRLVDDLLDVTRISRGKVELQREALDLAELVHRTCDDHRSLFDARAVELRLEVAGPIAIDADPTRMAQVIGNVLQNAAKFSHEGGVVTVAARVRDGRAEVRVRDGGVGIAQDLLPHVFEPFVQADGGLARTRGGLGLGLALVKGLVELHGGTVRLHSDGPDRGAEVVVSVPLSASAPRSAPAREAPVPGRRALSILVIEDNVDAAQTIAEILSLEGHTVHVATDGTSGLARARELRPDVVLSDIGLPDLDGYEIARRLRGDPAFRGTRLVALSGYAQPEDRRRAREAGFDAHLAKPLGIAEILAALAAG
jgi:PAS domain S-box-containing protein